MWSKWEKAYTLNIYFLKNTNTVVIFHALAGLERAVLGFLSTYRSAVCPPGREKGISILGICFLLLAAILRFGIDIWIDKSTMERALWGQHGITVAQKGLPAKGLSVVVMFFRWFISVYRGFDTQSLRIMVIPMGILPSEWMRTDVRMYVDLIRPNTRL